MASRGPRRSPVARRWAATLCVALAGAPALARAQTNDAALAETLFAEAKQLMAEERFAEACPKLEESQRLDPGGGTLLNLAFCHDREGRTATAWAEYKQALARARREERTDRVEIAEAKLAALEPRLSYLTVSVDAGAAAIAGLEVHRGEVALTRVAWGVATPVDPGSYLVSAAAPGYARWQALVAVTGEAQRQSVVVPPLVPASAPFPTVAPRPGADRPSPPPTSPWRTAGWIALGVGGVGVAAGSVFGLRAFSLHGDSNDRCVPRCTQEGVDLEDDARASARASTVLFSVGAAAIVAGVTLILVAPRDGAGAKARTALVPPSARPSGGAPATRIAF